LLVVYFLDDYRQVILEEPDKVFEQILCWSQAIKTILSCSFSNL